MALKRPWRLATILALVALVVPFVVSRCMSPWRRVTVVSTSDTLRPNDDGDPTTIRVASFNLAHGRGTAESNWRGGGVEDRMARLDEIAELLRNVDADIVVLNEVDFDASWSSHTNQARYLADKSGYAHRVEQRNFDFRVLLWTWRFGNAVLSKYPIVEAETVDLPGYSVFESVLAGKKRAVACDIDLDGLPLRIVAAHLSHRSEAVRVSAADAIVSLADESTRPMLVAGDMNSTPPDFPNSIRDQDGRNAIAVFDASRRFRRRPSDPSVDESDFTFPATDPRVVIDWILVPAKWTYGGYHVDSTILSDHRLVYVDVSPSHRPPTK